MARILMVGSDGTDREVRALIVEFGGHNCATAASLEEAVNLLQKGMFDLVVTELKLSGNSPEQVIKRMKVSPEMAVIVLTESGETVESADAVLPIPCSHEDLVRRIEHVLGKLIGSRAKYRREKRQFSRHSVNLPCLVKDLRGSQLPDGSAAHTINISRGGVYLVTLGDWKVRMQFEFVIQLPT